MPRRSLFIGMAYPPSRSSSAKGPAPSCRPMGRLSVVGSPNAHNVVRGLVGDVRAVEVYLTPLASPPGLPKACPEAFPL